MKWGDIGVRDFIAVMFSVGVFILVGAKIPVPDQIWSALLVILTFFFSTPKNGGSNVQNTDATVAPKS